MITCRRAYSTLRRGWISCEATTRHVSALQNRHGDCKQQGLLLQYDQRRTIILDRLAESAQSSALIRLVTENLCQFHDLTGLPWWATIGAVTLGLRCATLPFHVMSHKARSKKVWVIHEMDKYLIPELKQQTSANVIRHGWSEAQAKEYFETQGKDVMQAKIEEYKCNMSRILFPFICETFLWISMSMSMRLVINKNSQATLLQLAQESFLWVPSLISHDVILPVYAITMMFVNNELASKNPRNVTLIPTKLSQFRDLLIKAVLISMMLAGMKSPSLLTMYWAMSATSGVCVNLMLMSPKFRQFANIPRLPKGEPDHPYKQTLINIIDQKRAFIQKVYTLAMPKKK